MNEHEQNQAHFPPLIVDEQIDELLRSRRQRKGSPAADEQPVSDLQVLYEAASAGTRERVWQRLVDRIASNDAISASHKQGVRERNVSNERHRDMRNETLSPFVRKQRSARRSGMWGIVAAVILTALLVGSMAWIITLERYHNTGSDMGSPNGAKQQQPASVPVSYSGIYVQTTNNVQRVDAKTGKMIWHYEIPFIPASYDRKISLVSIKQFIVAGDTVYTLIAGPGDKNPSELVALKADTGKERWVQPLTEKPFVAPMYMALDDGVIYVETQIVQSHGSNNVMNYTIYSFSAKDGKRGSTYLVPENGYPFVMTVQKSVLYLPIEKGLYAIDVRSKKQLWQWKGTPPEGQGQSLVIRKPYILNGVLYTAIVDANEAGAGQSRVAAFNAENGKLLWQSDAFAGEAAAPTVVNGVMYVGSTIPKTGPFEGALYAFDATNGRQIWKVTTSGGVQWSPFVSNGVVYASVYAGMELKESVLAVDLKTGRQRWQHQIEKGLMTTPYEQDGVVYEATGFDKGTLYALNASDGSQKWTLDVGDSPNDLTVVE
jgi:outer membrane protein assembly factor BamB